MPVDWSAAPNALNPLAVEQQSQQFGLEQGQRQATINALQGVNLNDPASIDAGIGNLIHANAIDQAKGLMGLNVSRTFNSAVLPMIQKRLAADSGMQSSDQAQTPTGQTPVDPNSPQFAAQHQDVMGQAQQAVHVLQQTPPDQRPQAAAALKQKFVSMGIPEASIDDHLSDLSDAGLAKTADYFNAQSQWTQQGGAASGQPAPPHPTGYEWATNFLKDPVLNDPFVQALSKNAGFDIEPYMSRAVQVAQPFISKEAELQNAGPIAEAQVPAHLAEKLGGAAIDAAYARRIAEGRASGDLAGRAPGTIVEVPMGDGSTQRGTFTPSGDGKTYTFKPIQAEGGSGTPGAPVGRTLTPGQQHAQTEQAGQAADAVRPDPKVRDAAQATLDNSQRILSIVGNMKIDPSTPIKGQIANALRIANVPGSDQVASEIADLDGAMKQGSVGNLHSMFPQRITDRDVKLGSAMYGGLTTPNDRLKVVWGLAAAQAQRAAAYEDFKANYKGPLDSANSVQKAWLAQGGGQSFYQSPVWSHIAVTGKDGHQHPLFDPSQDVLNVDGHKVGVWGGWTNHPVTFPLK